MRPALDFAGGVVSQVTLTTLPGNSVGDGSGHGTFVAALAAGSATGYAGAAPTAQILSIDVADDKGMSMTSDVIAAVDWILANKDAKKIGVANFSLHSSVPSSFVYDPLAKAVERLWLSGVVVVAAAGNYATNGAASGVPFAPGEQPVRDHRRRGRHRQHHHDLRRRCRPLVGARLHARRLREARARAPPADISSHQSQPEPSSQSSGREASSHLAT